MDRDRYGMTTEDWRRRLLDMVRAGLVWTGAEHETMKRPLPAGLAKRLGQEVADV